MAQLISPKTGELISVHSQEFSELLADPKYRKTILSSSTQPIEQATATPSSPRMTLSPRTSLPPLSPRTNSPSKFATIPSLEETLKHTTQPSKREKLEKMKMNVAEGRGIKTRGWSGRKPTRGKERHQLMQECGKECFLLPEQEKFPICQSPRMTGKVSNCTKDCGGIQSALIRARQYKYDDVAEKAKELLKECNQEGLKNFIPTSPRRSPRIPSSVARAGRTDSHRSPEYDGRRGRSPEYDGRRGRSPEREYSWGEKSPERKRDMEYMARKNEK